MAKKKFSAFDMFIDEWVIIIMKNLQISERINGEYVASNGLRCVLKTVDDDFVYIAYTQEPGVVEGILARSEVGLIKYAENFDDELITDGEIH